jgi:A/G-specific adenine glycosylase
MQRKQPERPRQCAVPEPDAAVFAERLLGWYDRNKRDLPWRKNRDPYRVWLSEIMLQQTRVAAVLEHYRKFLKKFPNVKKLAAARESSVLAAWSGLGYYRRARMLHAAAKEVSGTFSGEFPASARQLRDLPGIGRYTAAAIASIAFGEAVAVVDGNVERVLARVAGRWLADEAAWQEAERLLSSQRPGDFNQAMMELGATVCVPGPPKCLLCPMQDFCATRGELAKEKPGSKQRKRKVHYALGRKADAVFLVQRARDAALMPGMWELPELTNGQRSRRALLQLRHSITVTDYDVRVVEAMPADEVAGKWIPRQRLGSMALTGLGRKILRQAGLI